MPSISGEIDFEVWCGECGSGLCGETDVRGGSRVTVDLCPKCREVFEDEIATLIDQLDRVRDERDSLLEQAEQNTGDRP